MPLTVATIVLRSLSNQASAMEKICVKPLFVIRARTIKRSPIETERRNETYIEIAGVIFSPAAQKVSAPMEVSSMVEIMPPCTMPREFFVHSSVGYEDTNEFVTAS